LPLWKAWVLNSGTGWLIIDIWILSMLNVIVCCNALQIVQCNKVIIYAKKLAVNGVL
jgi:hypothetical protein